MRFMPIFVVGLVAGLSWTGAEAVADAMRIEAVMSPKEQIKLDFKDGSKHFVLLVRREGKAEGSGPLAGGSVVEYGMHDIIRGVGGHPRGYLEITTPSGDIAYIKWTVRAVFVPGEGGKPRLLDNGVWEIVGGTGAFAGMKGAGTMHIKPVTKTDRRFILEGDLVPAS
jgi:hypothetical protein